MGVGGGLFVSLTLEEDTRMSENLGELIEGLCTNMMGRIYISIATVGPSEWPPWRSALSGMLIAHLCSHNNTGWFSKSDAAVRYHEHNFESFQSGRDDICSVRISPGARGLYTGDLLYNFVIESLEIKERTICCEDMFARQVEGVVMNCGCRSCRSGEIHSVDQASVERTQDE
jgi:hypothetical protein